VSAASMTWRTSGLRNYFSGGGASATAADHVEKLPHIYRQGAEDQQLHRFRGDAEVASAVSVAQAEQRQLLASSGMSSYGAPPESVM